MTQMSHSLAVSLKSQGTTHQSPTLVLNQAVISLMAKTRPTLMGSSLQATTALLLMTQAIPLHQAKAPTPRATAVTPWCL